MTEIDHAVREEMPIRVLLVDDHDAFLVGASDWLADQHGFHVVGAVRSGAEALSAVERLQPDLVLMDLVMPGIDGFEATRRIKARPDAPIVIALTFHSGETVREQAMRAGADDLVGKSEFVDALAPLIKRLSRERRDG